MSFFYLLLIAVFFVEIPSQLFVPDIIGYFRADNFFNLPLIGTGIYPFITTSILFSVLSLIDAQKKQKYNYLKIFSISLSICILSNLLPLVGKFEFPFTLDKIAFLAYVSLLMMAGMSMCVWIAIFVSRSSIINGLSLLVFISILKFTSVYFYNNFYDVKNLLLFLFFIFIVFCESIFYNIRLSLPNQKSFIDKKITNLPLKLNSSGIMPVIIIYSLDFIISHFTADHYLYNLIKNAFIVVALFYVIKFYSSVIINVEDITKRLKNSNLMLISVRPGAKTEAMLKYIVSKLDILSFLYLSFVVFAPSLLFNVSNFSGLTIVILVTVSLEMLSKYKQNSVKSGNYSL